VSGVTIVMPTYNRLRALEAVWPSYLRQEQLSEIVVVDDGCTDGTGDMVTRWGKGSRTPVRVIRNEKQLGQPTARRIGLASVKTEWVLFGEDDVWLDDGYCRALLEDAARLSASVIAGRIVTARVPGEFSEALLVDPATPTADASRVFDLHAMDADFAARTASPVSAPFLHSIALIRRDVFDRVSFDSWYAGNGWREETDFYLSANSIGDQAWFTPNAVCYHLRGPICSSGGQRVNRLFYEYLAWRNTRHLVSKHWNYLNARYGMRGSVTGWMLRYYSRRQIAQLRRAASNGLRSNFDG
jgi:glycosyltransferase involved in cell wall biosynthesis